MKEKLNHLQKQIEQMVGEIQKLRQENSRLTAALEGTAGQLNLLQTQHNEENAKLEQNRKQMMRKTAEIATVLKSVLGELEEIHQQQKKDK